MIDGRSSIGSHVSLQTGVYVLCHTTIGDHVFCGLHAVLTNDPYPVREDIELEGLAHVSIGINTTVLPGVTVGEGAFVVAGAVATEDVPPPTLAVGAFAVHRELPDQLMEESSIRFRLQILTRY